MTNQTNIINLSTTAIADLEVAIASTTYYVTPGQLAIATAEYDNALVIKATATNNLDLLTPIYNTLTSTASDAIKETNVTNFNTLFGSLYTAGDYRTFDTAWTNALIP